MSLFIMFLYPLYVLSNYSAIVEINKGNVATLKKIIGHGTCTTKLLKIIEREQKLDRNLDMIRNRKRFGRIWDSAYW